MNKSIESRIKRNSIIGLKTLPEGYPDREVCKSKRSLCQRPDDIINAA
jgi:hypothetical protein